MSLGVSCVGNALICFRDDCTSDDIVKAYAIGWFLQNSWSQEVSYLKLGNSSGANPLIQVAAKLRWLISHGAYRSLVWYANNWNAEKLAEAGWDIDFSKARLATDFWRFTES